MSGNHDLGRALNVKWDDASFDSIADLVSRIIESTAWPAAVLFLALIYRTPLLNLVDGLKLRRIRNGNFEADFERVVKEEVSPEVRGTRDKWQLNESLGGLSSAPSVSAILSAWVGLENQVFGIAEDIGLEEKDFAKVLDNLESRLVLDRSLRESIVGLRHLRDLAAHAPPSEITPKKAQEYVVMVNAAGYSLNQNLIKANQAK